MYLNRKYSLKDYSSLTSFLSNYDCSCVYSNNTGVAAADSFNKIILPAMDLAVPGFLLENPDSLTGFLDK
jgi:hypothetical protein